MSPETNQRQVMDVSRALYLEDPTTEGKFVYLHLPEALGEADSLEEYWRSEHDRLEEAGELPAGPELRRLQERALYPRLVQLAHRANYASGEPARADAANTFTEGSIGLFGAPDPGVVMGLVESEERRFAGLRERSDVSPQYLRTLEDFYEQLPSAEMLPARGNEKQWESGDALSSEVVEGIRTYVYGKYGELLDMAVKPEGTTTDVDEFVVTIKKALGWLADHDPAEGLGDWSKWKVTRGVPNTGLGMYSQRHELVVGELAGPRTRDQVLATLTRVLFSHTVRSVHGYRSGIPLLGADGLPGYRSPGQGIAEHMSTALLQQPPDHTVIKDQYQLVDYALRGYRRAELIGMQAAKVALRLQSAGYNGADLDDRAAKSARLEVNYIFTGGNGVDTVPAVFAHRTVNYAGIKSIRDYLENQTTAGVPIGQTLDYLMSGLFDPNNSEHVAYLERYGIFAPTPTQPRS